MPKSTPLNMPCPNPPVSPGDKVDCPEWIGCLTVPLWLAGLLIHWAALWVGVILIYGWDPLSGNLAGCALAALMGLEWMRAARVWGEK